jgi:hypothetical protein
LKKIITTLAIAALALSLNGCSFIQETSVASASYQAGKLFANAIPADQLEALNITNPATFCEEYSMIAESAATVEGFSAAEFSRGCTEAFEAK